MITSRMSSDDNHPSAILFFQHASTFFLSDVSVE